MERRQESRMIIAERLVTSFTKQSRDMVLTLFGGDGGPPYFLAVITAAFDRGHDLKYLHYEFDFCPAF